MNRKDTFGLDKDHVKATVEKVRNHLDRNLFAIPVYGVNNRKNSGKIPNLPKGYTTLYSVKDFSTECEGGIYRLRSSNLGEFGKVTFPSGKYPRLILNAENPHIGVMSNENGERDEKWFDSNADPDGWAGNYVNVGLALHPSEKWLMDFETREAYDAFSKHVEEMGWGSLEETYVDRSGGDGCHVGFNAPFRSQTFGKLSKPFGFEDLELKNSGQIIIPPSKHWTGGRYEVIQDNPYQDAPEWLVDEVERLSASSTESADGDKREYMRVEYDFDPEDPHFKENCQKTEGAIKKHNPGVGKLHSYSLDVAGFLVRRIGQDATEGIFENVWRNIHPEGLTSALRNVKDTARKLDSDKAVTGGGKLLDTHPELLDDLDEIWDWHRDERDFFDKSANKDERTVNEDVFNDIPYGQGKLSDLLGVEFEPERWVIDRFLPEGLTLLSGKPKIGKSILTLGWGYAVATGGMALGSIEVEKAGVLGLFLEDNPRRLQKRIKKMLKNEPNLDPRSLNNFHYFTSWPKAGEGGLKRLDYFLTDHPDVSLVVIDTLKMFRPVKTESGSTNVYDRDYEAVAPLRRVAEKHKVSVLVVTHNNKMTDPEDPFDAISGSTGLTGAVNNVIVLQKIPNKQVLTFNIDGHDIEEPGKYALVFDGENLSHHLDEDPEKHETSEERQEIIDLIADEGSPMKPTEVADELDKNRDATRKLMSKMKDSGQLTQEGCLYGKYDVPPSHSQSPSSPTTNTHEEERENGSVNGHGGHSGHTSTKGPTVTSVNSVTGGDHNSTNGRSDDDTCTNEVCTNPQFREGNLTINGLCSECIGEKHLDEGWEDDTGDEMDGEFDWSRLA